MGDPGGEPQNFGHEAALRMPQQQTPGCGSYISTHCQGAKTVVIEQAQMGTGVGVDAGVEDDSPQ